MSIVAAVLMFAAVAALAGAALIALKMWLAFRARVFSNEPIAALQRRIDEIESRLLAGAMRR